MALGDDAVFEACRECRYRQDCSYVAGKFEADAEILSVQGDLEANRVIVIDHSTASILENPRARCTAGKGLHDFTNVQTRLDCEGDTFGDT